MDKIQAVMMIILGGKAVKIIKQVITPAVLQLKSEFQTYW